ncbi:biopolymer transporter ExbD [Alistipes sp. OttesenSCG-928-B03]|nr:biopolymer transporter ExbD [Alistipes sp. OttesenSCG-928-B03]
MRKKGGKETPAISTASLPDIIFMLIFFFMIATQMRETEMMVQYKLPVATEAQKLEKKSLVSYIHIGRPTKEFVTRWGNAPRIQLNDSYRTPQAIGQFIASERDKLDAIDRHYMTVSLKADQNITMGLITDVKQELRKADALKISYAAEKDYK